MKTILAGLTPFDMDTIECINQSSHHEGQCARNSIMHLEKAYKLASIDPEMAYFRAITAEEEASSALFFSLKRLNYNNSEKLDPRDHLQKNAVYPYILAVYNYFVNKGALPFPIQLAIKNTNNGKIMYIKIQITLDKSIIPDPPLNFSITDYPIGEKVLFTKEFEEMAIRKGRKDIFDFVKEIANQRNVVLYAFENGIAHIDSGLDKEIDKIKSHVFILLKAFCLIFPYSEKSLFVQQIINGFLLSFKKIKKNEIIW